MAKQQPRAGSRAQTLIEFVVFDQRRLFNYRTPIHGGIAQLAFKVRADNIGVRGPQGIGALVYGPGLR